MTSEPTRQYLIVRTAGVGDVVMTSTLLARIKREQPAARVVWLCGDTAAPLVAALDGVDEVISVDERKLFRGGAVERTAALLGAWRQLGGRRFTTVFLAHVDVRYRALVITLVGSPVRALERGKTDDPNPIPGRFLGDEYARLLDPPGNTGPIEHHWPLATLRDSANAPRDERRIVLIPGGAKNVLRESALRRWPVESYAVLARALIERNYVVELIGNADDAWVRDSFAGLSVVDHLGTFALPETVRRLETAGAVVSHDTGPMHLARLARAPLVALFGPTAPEMFIGPDDRTTVLELEPRLACQPCYDGREFAACRDNICMSRIGVDRVLSAVTAFSGSPRAITNASAH